jgi:hypothetical protein
MTTLQQEFLSLSLRQLCSLLDVSRSWFYQRPHQRSEGNAKVVILLIRRRGPF